MSALVVAVLAALSLATGAASSAAASAPAAAHDDGRLNILLFYKPNFHSSNVQARQAVRDLATQLGEQYGQPVNIQETDDPSAFTTENLATRDVAVFAQTGGVLFNAAQRAALEAYIRGGGGYMGMHYAGWSVGEHEHDVNPFYARLVGAVSEGHPENPGIREGRVVVKDTSHPLTQGVPADFRRSDEWYDWVVNPAPYVRTLIEADEASYGGSNPGVPHPITWCQQIDAGRSWYTAMGHEGTAYEEAYMRAQMKNGLAYAAGLLAADCRPPATGDPIRLRSHNYTDHYVRQADFDARIDANPDSSDSQWRIVPGLAGTAGGDYVSIESVKFPGHYLRHTGFDFVLARNDDSELFKADATFKRVTGLADPTVVSFQSYNYPDRYLRHHNFALRLDPIDDAIGRADATFHITD
ncbi:type 1 glutamine amidotransferase [Thermocatellispora tengchongensis]|uniref:Type 1 glutamine amidotransferase n=1 Tax=Thermocatellispora tengchongensis TaxID=1073253 RepID=A0A840PQ32_9ACTN|nr:ThuA domain-containing protein [Thermocatellispora tengchongensis]MBB5139850.1 type 1 glutamine amidotransferase [Thermocatellispora tengchongensis]